MAKFDLSDYETVEARLARFWKSNPEGRILTELVFHDERRFIVKAEIHFDRNDMTPVATGYAEEIVGASPVNRTSALENCETSAIGRGLANCTFASAGKRPSRTEMEKVERYQTEPRKAPASSKRDYTAEEIKVAEDLMTLIPTIDNLEQLRKLWDTHGDIRDLPINGTTLKDIFNKRATDIAENNQA
jgi:hypothetical protein